MNQALNRARPLGWGVLAFTILLAFSIIATRAAAASGLSPQTSQERGVSIQVTPHTGPNGWTFDFALNTHSGSLSEDLKQAVVLVADGKKTYTPLNWQGDAPGGHHRKGTLSFEPISPQPKAIELRLQRPGEAAPRSFRWELR